MADASHELRTPLAILKTELELARRSGRSVEELEAALRSAGEETDRLAQLADDLLVIARSDQGRLEIATAPVGVRDLLEGVRRRFARRAADAGSTCAWTLPRRPRRRWTGSGSSRHSATSWTTRCATAPDPWSCVGRTGPAGIELAVRDHGPGFPPEFAGQAFERFTRADTGRSSGGAGLGLAIVEAIATAHGGSASVRNLDGGGAEVAIGLTGLSSDGGTPGRSDQEV